ncbi:S1C family serine protease [Amphibacillus indicireducens]|uniref:Serine protease n=1 Tax=Amphibacillus indicireducens TaxID=1076330 RepID=A0ABP7VWN6_9BACI
MEQDQEQIVVDTDFHEEIEPEEMLELLEQEKAKLRAETKQSVNHEQSHSRKWVLRVLIFALLLNVVAILPRTFSIPAIDFLKTSARLSADEAVQTYKEAVVVIDTGDGKGTGFGITADGLIVTNHHVIEGEETVIVNYPGEGLFIGNVVAEDGAVDLALVQVAGTDLPYLSLADHVDLERDRSVLFIGNPLRFNGIANQGDWIGMTSRDGLETKVMMLDAPVYRGNSGSPVINDYGDVIGVIYATTTDQEYGKIGLAIPIENLDRLLSD